MDSPLRQQKIRELDAYLKTYQVSNDTQYINNFLAEVARRQQEIKELK